MKDEFLATLSHELRTPLNAILGWSQILRVKAPPSPDLSRGIETIERNARAQAQIIEDLLDMSAIISGKICLDVARIQLADIVQAAVEAARPAADAKRVAVVMRLGRARDSELNADAGRIQQVLWNLINNAIKFTAEGGSVEVVLECSAAEVTIRVSDSGEGIDPDFLPFVFDRFRQADATITRRYGGLGLGLSIVKQLVELHGGSVSADSPGRGRGSTFVVSFPRSTAAYVVEAAPATALGERATRAAADGCQAIAGLKVLVVDDDPDARDLVRRLLEDCNVQVITTGDAKEALSAVKREQLDVLVSDIGMPGSDGYELIQRVRSLGSEGAAAIPALALTAYARPEDRTKALRAGFQMHLAKPVDPRELIAVVASLGRRV